MINKWEYKEKKFEYNGKRYLMIMSRIIGDHIWHATYRKIGGSKLYHAYWYTTMAHALRGVKRSIDARRKVA